MVFEFGISSTHKLGSHEFNTAGMHGCICPLKKPVRFLGKAMLAHHHNFLQVIAWPMTVCYKHCYSFYFLKS